MSGRNDVPQADDMTGLQSFDDFELRLGDVMRGERATLGKSLLDVQREIKIKAGYLAAIENADLNAFETPGFIAGYVRSYARYLGMNPDWAYRVFCEESGFSHVAGLQAQVYTRRDAQPRPAGRAKGGRDVSDDVLSRSPIPVARSAGAFAGLQAGAVGSLLVLAGLTVALGYGGWSVLQEVQRVTLAPVETQLSAIPGRSAPVPEAEGAAPLPAESLLAGNTPPTTEALERLYRPEPLERPVMVARDSPIATLDPRRQGLYAQYAALPDAPDPVRAAPAMDLEGPVRAALSDALGTPGDVQVTEARPPEVVLFARRPVWVRVRGADGTILLEKILEEGERYVLPDVADAPTLRAGNSGSLFFAVNGRTFGPAGPGASVAKNVRLSADALTDVYAEADLSGDAELARMAELVIAPDLPGSPAPAPAPAN